MEWYYYLIIGFVLLLFGVNLYFAVFYSAKHRQAKAKKTERNIAAKQLAQGEILLCGSSFMENWKSAKTDFLPLRVENIAIGGSVTAEWYVWADKLIIPLHPKTVVIYVGSNDINGGKHSKKGKDTAQEIIALFEKLKARLTDIRIYFISIAPTIARWHVWSESNECNLQIAHYSENHSYVKFIDCTKALLNEDGSLRKEIYKSDRLHFNEKGYAIWKKVIVPFVQKNLDLE